MAKVQSKENLCYYSSPKEIILDKHLKKIILFILLCSFSVTSPAVTTSLNKPIIDVAIQPGAERTNLYLPLLQNKNVGVVVNPTSRVGDDHLIDVLIKKGIHIKKIFTPEHGLRGDLDEKIDDSIDEKTGIPIVSLYGKKYKPTPEDLSNVDILVFDMQDVGVRFYTYISTMQKVMEAATENNKPIIILDRPNPNGFYVDGPVLDPKFKSFTGMQPIAFVHGMTIGEYAQMLIGEEWLEIKPASDAKKLNLTVIPVANYTHESLYEPKVKPSPALPEIQSIYLYASFGFFESTYVSVGRGTTKPFQYYGHPSFPFEFTFIPTKQPTAKNPPPYENQVCHGWNFSGTKEEVLKIVDKKVNLKYILAAYKFFPKDKKFFDDYFNNAAGNDILKEQIKSGMSEEEIRKSWEPKLSEFKQIRKKYLLYPDFKS